ncbi:peroxin [Sticta canariensis]|nr:peroxin [Sticta canariensis]
MITATKNWLRRNRTNFAIGFGVLGVGYVTGQYALSKITEAGERMGSDRTAKENLRRRFQQNQEDCTITVLALLPTATENIVEALPVESITHELQQKKSDRSRSADTLDGVPTELSSGPPSVTDDDGRSLASFQSSSYVHASQMETSSSGIGDLELRNPSKTKAQLWNELKINSITRAFTLLYTLSLLTLLTRIQLNLLGRRNYLSSVVSSASHPSQDPTISLENRDDDNVEQSYGNDFETNRKFLTFSWWLLHRGWRDIKEKAEAAVRDIFGPLNPREDIPLERLSSLILDVRRRVEGATTEERKAKKWLPYLLPLPDQEDSVLHESGISTTPPSTATANQKFVPSPPSFPSSPSSITTPPLRRLLDETSDLIDSPPFSQILTLLLDTTFSRLTDQNLRSQAFKLSLPSLPRIQEVPSPRPSTTSLPTVSAVASNTLDNEEHTGQEYNSANQPKAKLATILAVMSRQVHVIGSGMPNEYVQAMEEVRELDAFAAVVYSSHFELGVTGDANETGIEPVAEAESRADREEILGGREEMPLKPRTERKEEGAGVIGKATEAFESVWGRVIRTTESEA